MEKMRYSILHISDLHKKDGVDYTALLQSLEKEMRLWQEEQILSPTFIVVSGDLIQGANNENEIQKQYEEVEKFLTSLVQLILKGDKQRIIIVPGNHDVNRCTTRTCMCESHNNKEDDRTAYQKSTEGVRWSLSEYKYYFINDIESYSKRFSCFIDFYNRFYEGLRTYPANPDKQAYTITFDEYKITFAGFNSCQNIDHLRDVGQIDVDALVYVGGALKESYDSGYLNVGVWHHNYYGPPLATNYMDKRILDDMIQYNVHIGLYGHQHYSQVANEYVDLTLSPNGKNSKLLLITSGTLFGGKKSLPFGCKRQYNIIEIELQNGKANVSINVRVDQIAEVGSLFPYWRRKPLGSEDNKIEVEVATKELDAAELLRVIDKVVAKDGNYKGACESFI